MPLLTYLTSPSHGGQQIVEVVNLNTCHSSGTGYNAFYPPGPAPAATFNEIP